MKNNTITYTPTHTLSFSLYLARLQFCWKKQEPEIKALPCFCFTAFTLSAVDDDDDAVSKYPINSRVYGLYTT